MEVAKPTRKLGHNTWRSKTGRTAE